MADNGVVGLCVVKINGLFEVDAKSARWDVRRPLAAHTTQAGNKQATGFPVATLSLEEVIPREGARNWRSLKKFSVEITDAETEAVVFYGEETNWDGLSGSTDNGSASTTKSISAQCAKPLEY